MDKLAKYLTAHKYHLLRVSLVWLSIAVICTFVIPETSFVHQTAQMLSTKINQWYLILGYLLLIAIAYVDKDKGELKLAAHAGLAGLFSVHLLKLTVGCWATRPSGRQGGFPSGHSDAAFILAYLISRRFPAVTLPVFVLAGGISWSRVVVDAHWLYQVIGGGMIGIATVFLIEQSTVGTRKVKAFPIETEKEIMEETHVEKT